MITEAIPDRLLLKFFYENALGLVLVKNIFSKKLFSRIYALIYKGKTSRSKIEPFINRYDIMIEEFERRNYSSFNDFFTRRFKQGARKFVADPFLMPACAEARYLAWASISPGRLLPVKSRNLSIETLLNSEKKAAHFLHGPLIIARLAPQDYHRVHFIDSGTILDHYRIAGNLHSVNPIAIAAKSNILCTNTREVTVQETENFGTIVYIEIGAMTIGGIVQLWHPEAIPQRGQEKSYFEYGGSTVVVLGQPGRWVPDADILAYTRRGIETFVELGAVIARRETG